MMFSYIDKWIDVSQKALASLTLVRQQPIAKQ